MELLFEGLVHLMLLQPMHDYDYQNYLLILFFVDIFPMG
jgi:hypothetical protein